MIKYQRKTANRGILILKVLLICLFMSYAYCSKAQVTLLKDINKIGVNSSPAKLTAYQGKVYFTATDRAHGAEL